MIYAGYPTGKLCVLLVNDSRIREFNKVYRGIDRTTDILSFSMKEGLSIGVDSAMLGDIVISLPAAKRQSFKCKKDIYSVLTELLIHGILHLLGYDHETSTYQAKKMKKKEKEIFERIKGLRIKN